MIRVKSWTLGELCLFKMLLLLAWIGKKEFVLRVALNSKTLYKFISFNNSIISRPTILMQAQQELQLK